MRLLLVPALLVASFVFAACGESGDEAGRLVLATTTSTRDSGLLDRLLPIFEEETGCRVDVVAVGTGAALELGRNGDADIVLVHARDAEDAFMAEGHATRHEEFMVNHFVILGPEEDPAGIRGQDAAEAFRLMADAGATFVSRGDDSGTHEKEKSLRALAGLEECWPELLESAQPMGATLLMADEMGAYTLCDSGTWLSRRSKLRLVALVASGAGLRNPYAVMPVSAEKHPSARTDLAEKLAEFLISKRAQEMIRAYRIEGERLFTPTRLEERGN